MSSFCFNRIILAWNRSEQDCHIKRIVRMQAVARNFIKKYFDEFENAKIQEAAVGKIKVPLDKLVTFLEKNGPQDRILFELFNTCCADEIILIMKRGIMRYSRRVLRIKVCLYIYIVQYIRMVIFNWKV